MHKILPDNVNDILKNIVVQPNKLGTYTVYCKNSLYTHSHTYLLWTLC